MDSTDAYDNDYEGILAKALQHIKELKEENSSLSSELALARGQSASCRVDHGRVEVLERTNQELTSELDATRKKLLALREIATKSISDLKQEAQHLNKKLEAACTVLDLYELLYDVDVPPTRTQRGEDGAKAPGDRTDQVIAPVEKRLRVVPGDRQPERCRPYSGTDDPEERTGEALSGARNTSQASEPLADHRNRPASSVAQTELTAPEAASIPLEAETAPTRVDDPAAILGGASAGAILEPPLRPTDLPPDYSDQNAPSKPDFNSHTEEDAELSSPASEIDFVTSPFTRFDTINKFTAAVRSLPGVTDAKVRHFQKGTLRMLVEYENVVPFVNRLRELAQFKLRIESSSGARVVATLEPQDSNMLVAAGAH